MSSDIDGFCGSKFWDDSLTWNTNNPYFTPCFEKTFLVWMPCLFLWICSPLEILYIVHSKTKNVPWSFLNVTKLLLVTSLVLLNIIDIVVSITDFAHGVNMQPVDLWSPAIKIVTFIFTFALIFWNKRQGLRTSGIMFLFWLFLTVAGLPQFRTEINHITDRTGVRLQTFTYIIHFVVVLLILILNLFSDVEPKVSPYSKEKKPCPEVSASFVSRLIYAWFDRMAWLGYKKPLTSEDLWSMRPQDSGDYIIRQFSKYWIPVYERFFDEQQGKKNHSEGEKPKRVSVIMPLVRAFLPASSIGLVFRLAGDLCAFINPFILRALIGFVSRDEPMWKGYMYAVLLFLMAEAQTLFQTHSMTLMYELGLRIRTALISVIYKKALRTSNNVRKGTTVGQIVNLMSVDAQNFYELMPFLNLAWAAPITIGVSFFLLWQSIGVAALAGLMVMLIILPFNSYIASLVKKRQTKQMALKDERIKKMNEILSGMKVLKLYAWEPSFEEQILKIREEELKLLKSAAMLNASTSFAWASSPFIVSFVSFSVYLLTDERNVLDSQLAFYCLALINIMRIPIAMLPTLIQMAIIASVSLKRINKYLSNEELDETAVSHDQTESASLIIENGTFAWERGQNVQPTLKNISVEIGQGELVAVVGTVGSGKSSFIAAFLGEIEKISGYVNTKGKIAYVGQQAWIQNSSLKDNILFGSRLDEKRYQRVVNACALRPDFDMLPGGDMTEIGEKGINLSGGQKQRVSLARAVYSDAQIYFLDDPLSAVDSHVGKHIFDNVIGPNGLLRKKTRVLVTHAITYLPQVDMIFVLKDGEIPERGTYIELLAKKQEFADFLMQHLSESVNSKSDESLNIDEILGTDTDLRAKFERQISVTASNRSNMSVLSRIRKDSVLSVDSGDTELPEIVVPTRTDKLIKVEQSETGSVKLSIYGHYFLAAGLTFVILMMVFNVSAQLFTIFTNLWLSRWSSDPTTIVNGVQDVAKRDLYLGVYGGIGFLQIIATVLSAYMLVFGTISASRWLHVTILNNIFHCPMSFFDTTPTGRIVNRFSKDLDTVDTLIPMNCSAFINCFVQVVGILCVISYSTPIFIVVVIPIGILYVFVQRFYLSTSRQLKRIESVSRSPIFSHFSETVSGASIIRAYGAQARFIRTNEEKVDQNQMSLYPSQISARWLGIRLETVGNFIIFFAALFTVIYRDTMDPGIAGVSINYALQVTLVLNFCVRMTSELETNIVTVERIKEYAEIPQEAAWYTNKKPEHNWPEKGKVEFRDYQVCYREGLDLVLKGISFTVNGGEKIGIVGRTGAGKSSLTLCLFRILEAAGGSILIDGVDISRIGLNDLRSRLTIIPQDPVLFSGTLRVNLDPSGKHTDEAVWEALTLSHLSGFVRTLPNGLNYEITEGGDNLSVGQAQLLCLARALLRKSKVLVMDEATAAVDLDTDDLIQRTIRTEFKECTVLTIAHRLNTIMDYDRVVVLDKGLLKEYDSPANLLKDTSSIFYGMAKDAGLVY